MWIEPSFPRSKNVCGCRKMVGGGGNCVGQGIFRTELITEMERTAPISEQQLSWISWTPEVGLTPILHKQTQSINASRWKPVHYFLFIRLSIVHLRRPQSCRCEAFCTSGRTLCFLHQWACCGGTTHHSVQGLPCNAEGVAAVCGSGWATTRRDNEREYRTTER